jgi:hypothetical protein
LLSLSLQTATRLDFAKTHLEIIESILKGIFEDDRRIYCVANLETAKRLQAGPKQEYFLMDFITELPDADKSGIVNLIGTFSDSTGNPLFSKVLHLAAKLLGQDPEDATVLGVVGYMQKLKKEVAELVSSQVEKSILQKVAAGVAEPKSEALDDLIQESDPMPLALAKIDLKLKSHKFSPQELKQVQTHYLKTTKGQTLSAAHRFVLGIHKAYLKAFLKFQQGQQAKVSLFTASILAQLLTPGDSAVFLQLVETVFFPEALDEQGHTATLVKYYKVSLQMDNSSEEDRGSLGHLLPLKKDWLLNPLFFIWDTDNQIQGLA